MTASLSTNSMAAHMLNPVKGWPTDAPLDFAGEVGDLSYLPNDFKLVAGMCCHLGPDGRLYPGVANKQLGLFLFQGVNDLDVIQTGRADWRIATPTGVVSALWATGAVELETTEFVTVDNSGNPLTYNVGDMLRSPTTGADAGKLTNQNVTLTPDSTPGNPATAVVGIVTKPPYRNAYGVLVLRFIPVWYPGKSTEV